MKSKEVSHIMDAERYKKIIKEQEAYYERDVRNSLLSGRGVMEDSPEYPAQKKAVDRPAEYYCRELREAYESGLRVTVEGRDIMPGEFSVAAGLLAEGRLTRRVIRGNCAPEYRMSIKTLVR